MEIGMLSRKRKPIDPKKAVFKVRPERAREVVRQRFQSELVAVRRLLEKAAAIVPVPRSSDEPPAKRSKKASITPVVPRRKMMAEEEQEVGVVGGVSPMAMAIGPPPLQLTEDECVDICGDASPVATPKNLGDHATNSGSPSSSNGGDSDSGSDSDSDSDESVAMAEEEGNVDICGGVSPMVIAPAPLQLAEEEGEDICSNASPVATKNLGDDGIISGSPSSSSSSDSDSGDSASDSSSSGSSCSISDSDSDSYESVDSPCYRGYAYAY